MDERLSLKYPVVVEGKYDKAHVALVVASPIIALDGFSIFKNEEKKQLLKRLCAQTGLIILTDSDRAGNFIRARLKDFLHGEIFNVYTSCIKGKERRKERPSADGILGVEGVPAEELRRILMPFESDRKTDGANITKSDFYADGFSGGAESETKRKKLAAELSLPQTLTANALLEAINLTVTAEEYRKAADRVING